MCVLLIFGIHSFVLVYVYKKTCNQKKQKPEIKGELPKVTIQLPMFNEYFVVERLINSVCNIKYPLDKLEIQVLDDSTDDTQILAKELVNTYQHKGYNIKYLHRTDRTGYKAGALKEALEVLKAIVED